MGQMYFPGESANINGFVSSHRVVEGGMTFYYTGNMRNGKRHGQGKIEGSGYEDGHRCSISFDGEWYNDEPYTGEGISSLSNGDYWRFKIRYGSGEAHFRITDKCGVCEGTEDIKTDRGRGTLKYNDGRKYDGELYCRKPHGYGKLTYPSYDKYERDRYEGMFKDGNRSGKGTLRYCSGLRYEGEYKDDLMHGSGCLHFSTGAELMSSTGGWVRGRKEGNFIYYSPRFGSSVRRYKNDKQID